MSEDDNYQPERIVVYKREGDEINGYKIGKRVGIGSTSLISQVTKDLGTFVLKEIGAPSSKEYEITNFQEIDILSRLEHPYLIHAIDIIIPSKTQNINNISLILPNFSFDLRSIMYNSNYKEEEKFRNIFQIACAVQFLHSHNILHLDIKPENILLRGVPEHTMKAVLTDFGISAYSTNGEIMLDLEAMTYLYRSPESCKLNYRKEDNLYTNKDDSWSFGMLIFELFSDKELFYKLIKQRIFPDPVWHYGVCQSRKKIRDIKDKLKCLRFKTYKLLTVSEDKRDDVLQLLNGLLDPDVNTRWTLDQVIKNNLFCDFIVPEGHVVQGENIVVSLELQSRVLWLLEQLTIIFVCADLRIEKFFLAVDLLYRVHDAEIDDTVLLCACFSMADNLIDDNIRNISESAEDIAKILRVDKISEEAIICAQGVIVQKLKGVLYRSYVYKDCETLEQLDWVYNNIIFDVTKYVNYKSCDIPELGGTSKSTSTTFRDVYVVMREEERKEGERKGEGEV